MSDILSISLLNLLSKSEMTALGKYLQSPFFSNKKHLIHLFKVLRSTGERASEHPEWAFMQVFPKESFQQHKWNKALSEFNACIRDFLAIQRFQQHPELYLLAEAESLFQRDNSVPFQRATRSVLGKRPGYEIPDKTDAWWLRFQFHKLAKTHPHADHFKNTEANVNDMEMALDTYYYLIKLQFACNYLTGVRVLQEFSTQRDFKVLLQQAEEYIQIGDCSPLLRVYCSLTNLLGGYGVQFEEFYHELVQHRQYLAPTELAVIIAHGYNYCNTHMRQGYSDATGWFLKLLALEPEGGTSQAEGIFMNVAVSLAKSGQKEAFDQLLDAKRDVVPIERREDALNLLSACMHFYLHDYVKAQEKLVRVTSRNKRYTLMWHGVLVRNLYMLFLQDPHFKREQLDAALDHFSDFLERQSTYSITLTQSFIELIWFIRQMCEARRLRINIREKLLREIDKRQPACQDWIVPALNQLPE